MGVLGIPNKQFEREGGHTKQRDAKASLPHGILPHLNKLPQKTFPPPASLPHCILPPRHHEDPPLPWLALSMRPRRSNSSHRQLHLHALLAAHLCLVDPPMPFLLTVVARQHRGFMTSPPTTPIPRTPVPPLFFTLPSPRHLHDIEGCLLFPCHLGPPPHHLSGHAFRVIPHTVVWDVCR
jgi:hypothetical protein